MNNVFPQIGLIWKRLGIGQKVTILAMAGIVGVGIAALVVLAQRPAYELLYADLDEKDLGQMVAFLRDAKTPFRITGGGRTLLVPEGKGYDIKAQLAGKSLTPSSGRSGLGEIGGNGWAMTPSQEQLVQRRALQGELSRVIMHMEPVAWADVQIALGENSSFLEREVGPSAAVTLRVKPGQTLRAAQVAGIRQLVASSIQNLEVKNVSVVDDQGVLLSAPDADPASAQASTIQNHRLAVEQSLSAKAQDLLIRALGPGKAEVRVTATLDMDLKSQTSERFDLQNKFAKSEKTTSKTSTSAGASGAPTSTSEEQIENVTEAPKTTLTVQTAPGEIRRLDVAVIVDPTFTDAEGKEQRLADTEIEKLGKLVQTSVGFNAERNDTFQLTAMPFRRANAAASPEVKQQEKAEQREYILKVARNASPVAAVLIFVAFGWLVLRKIGKADQSVPTDSFDFTTPAAAASGAAAPAASFELPSGAHAALRNRVKDLIEKDPAAATRMLQNWLQEDK